MKAGRELDELVATRVMGWARGEGKFGRVPWISPEPINGVVKFFAIPCFSTEIVWAERVLGKFPRWEIDRTLSGVCANMTGNLEDRACAETLSLAICLSALMAADRGTTA